jgi:DNA-binding NarL/FixJ family response regulator
MSALNDLTPRQLEIFECIAACKSNKEIASELFITNSAVRNHISGIMAVLGLKNRTQIAVLAFTLKQ